MNFLLPCDSLVPIFSKQPKGVANCRPESIQTPSLVGQHASRRPHAFGRSVGQGVKWFRYMHLIFQYSKPDVLQYCTSLLLVYHYNHLAFFDAYVYIYMYSKPSHISCVFPHIIPINHEQQNSKIARLASRMGFTLFRGQCSRLLRLLLLRCKRQLIQRKPGVWNSKIHSMLTL